MNKRTKQRAEEHSLEEPLTQDEANSIAADMPMPLIPHKIDGQLITKIAIGVGNDWRVDMRTREHYPLAVLGRNAQSGRGLFVCF